MATTTCRGASAKTPCAGDVEGVRPHEAHGRADGSRPSEEGHARRAVLVRLHSRRAGDRLYLPNGKVSSEPGYARVQLEQIDIARRTIATLSRPSGVGDHRGRYPARRSSDGKVGSLLGMEGGHAIENSLGALRAYYDLGVRYMTLTHNVTLDWADAALDSARHGGLTPFGKEVVREMNRLGHARRPLARLARHDERRARRGRGAGHLLALRGARARGPPAQRAGFDPPPRAEERRDRDGAVRDRLRVQGGLRA